LKVEVTIESAVQLEEYSSISIAFTVERVLDVATGIEFSSGFRLTERPIDVPFEKDYDLMEGPAQWGSRFDVSNWVLFVARADGIRVGSAAVAWKTPNLVMLDGRDDVAVLWDLRVAPGVRREGVGSALFRAVEAWAATHGILHINVETQNINLAACRFYAQQGCMLRAANPLAYPQLPDEIQLLWSKDVQPTASAIARRRFGSGIES
jgi:GNAT superfamily N-acetyltransferase